jgi:hypothetical protein
MLRLVYKFDVYRQDMENESMDQKRTLARLYKKMVIDGIDERTNKLEPVKVRSCAPSRLFRP